MSRKGDIFYFLRGGLRGARFVRRGFRVVRFTREDFPSAFLFSLLVLRSSRFAFIRAFCFGVLCLLHSKKTKNGVIANYGFDLPYRNQPITMPKRIILPARLVMIRGKL